jgi:hypothetical protein
MKKDEEADLSIEEVYNEINTANSLKPGQFGDLLKKASQALQLSDEQISEEFGISKLTAMRWRKGKSSPPPVDRRMVYEWLAGMIKAKL